MELPLDSQWTTEMSSLYSNTNEGDGSYPKRKRR
jgi:hypothetical protein